MTTVFPSWMEMCLCVLMKVKIILHICLRRAACALNLPSIAAYNVRSLFPKLSNVIDELLEREINCSFFPEIWEKAENKLHQFEIEKMFEMHGLKYLSSPRPSGWGGVAIIANQDKFILEKLNICVPNNLEVIWGLLKVKMIILKR